jgi:hypothetical protein
LELYVDRGPRRRELDGVDQEIGDHVVDQAAVGQDEREVHVRLDVYLLALQFQPGSNVRYHVLDTMDQVERAHTQDNRAGLCRALSRAVDRPLQPCQVASMASRSRRAYVGQVGSCRGEGANVLSTVSGVFISCASAEKYVACNS